MFFLEGNWPMQLVLCLVRYFICRIILSRCFSFLFSSSLYFYCQGCIRRNLNFNKGLLPGVGPDHISLAGIGGLGLASPGHLRVFIIFRLLSQFLQRPGEIYLLQLALPVCDDNSGKQCRKNNLKSDVSLFSSQRERGGH